VILTVPGTCAIVWQRSSVMLRFATMVTFWVIMAILLLSS